MKHLRDFASPPPPPRSGRRRGGFSLPEVLTVSAILAVLAAVAVPSYTKYKERSYDAWVISEFSNVGTFLELARNVDGGYHQYIQAMGYIPKGVIYGNVGFYNQAQHQGPCCTKYPNPNTAAEAEFSGYSYLRKKTGTATKGSVAATIKQICHFTGEQDCSPLDNMGIRDFAGANILTGGGCSFSDKDGGARTKPTCDCDTYLLMGGHRNTSKATGTGGAIDANKGDRILAIDQKGRLCKVSDAKKMEFY